MARKPKVRQNEKLRKSESTLKSPKKKAFSMKQTISNLNENMSVDDVTTTGKGANSSPAKAAKPGKPVGNEAMSSGKKSSSSWRRLRKFKIKMIRYLQGNPNMKPSKEQLKRLQQLREEGWQPELKIQSMAAAAAATGSSPTALKLSKKKIKKQKDVSISNGKSAKVKDEETNGGVEEEDGSEEGEMEVESDDDEEESDNEEVDE